MVLKSLFFSCVMMVVARASAFDHTHSDWTKVLKTYVTRDSRVSYAKLKSDLAQDSQHLFSAYLMQIQSVALGQYQKFTRNEKMAFLINSYNALTVKPIVDKYPVQSIKDIGSIFKGAWKIKFFSLLGGKIQTLDGIEHDWLRPQFKDYRIHAAVNCASVSCPVLRGEAYTPSQLDAQLDQQMKVWINDSSRNQIKAGAVTWRVSKIFDWYSADFKDWGSGVHQVINKYLNAPVKGNDPIY